MCISVFLSYVRENSATVDRLKNDLEAHGISVWLDREALMPGQYWETAIRKAIRESQFFVACFSAEYEPRHSSWMNKELRLAIEEISQHPANRIWFIPVKLSSCEIPEFEIGPSKTLRALQHVELYPDWEAGLRRLLTVLSPANAEPGTPVSLPSSAQPLVATAREPVNEMENNIGKVTARTVKFINSEGDTAEAETPKGGNRMKNDIAELEAEDIVFVSRQQKP